MPLLLVLPAAAVKPGIRPLFGTAPLVSPDGKENLSDTREPQVCLTENPACERLSDALKDPLTDRPSCATHRPIARSIYILSCIDQKMANEGRIAESPLF
jgi:hypothetical protein